MAKKAKKSTPVKDDFFAGMEQVHTAKSGEYKFIKPEQGDRYKGIYKGLVEKDNLDGVEFENPETGEKELYPAWKGLTSWIEDNNPKPGTLIGIHFESEHEIKKGKYKGKMYKCLNIYAGKKK